MLRSFAPVPWVAVEIARRCSARRCPRVLQRQAMLGEAGVERFDRDSGLHPHQARPAIHVGTRFMRSDTAAVRR
jgi:hypothetical protein